MTPSVSAESECGVASCRLSDASSAWSDASCSPEESSFTTARVRTYDAEAAKRMVLRVSSAKAAAPETAASRVVRALPASSGAEVSGWAAWVAGVAQRTHRSS